MIIVNDLPNRICLQFPNVIVNEVIAEASLCFDAHNDVMMTSSFHLSLSFCPQPFPLARDTQLIM